ncbi:MAG: putative Serine/threonine protein phosphatase PP1 isozyme 7 [Streblomastix strix]|uniref:Serine/threonine-protein phosphatase n=1 Tax=Streblomastix strix TaxID=222440 RepID=A0A5J4WFH8_9EUKA|nr:MAG: putative Serine/threonine protein phosphatase PP1 isozyme 7 [Streblomastix strix]
MQSQTFTSKPPQSLINSFAFSSPNQYLSLTPSSSLTSTSINSSTSNILQVSQPISRNQTQQSISRNQTSPAHSTASDENEPKWRCTCFGDMHGHIQQLCALLRQVGLPEYGKHSIIFLGDYVDRGQNGVEVLCLVLALKLAFPDLVYILRGNHEDAEMNQTERGFASEVIKKYSKIKKNSLNDSNSKTTEEQTLDNKTHAAQIYLAFSRLYQAMPLAAVVNGCVFCVHGGVGSNLKLEEIQSLKREQSITDGTKPLKDEKFAEYGGITATMLWSDPNEQRVLGMHKSERGPLGCSFGPDVTEEFCKSNRLAMIVRSHQMRSTGFLEQDGSKGRCLTIFSVANYCQRDANNGAWCVLTFPSVSKEDEKQKKGGNIAVVARIEQYDLKKKVK